MHIVTTQLWNADTDLFLVNGMIPAVCRGSVKFTGMKVYFHP